MNRRAFLGLLGGTAAVAMSGIGAFAGTPARRLICVHLFGGNDGLNTVVPVGDARYRAARPTLALGASEVYKIAPGVGLHNALEPLRAAWERGHMAIVQGVGYPQPSRSHFRSTAIWQSAMLSGASDEGWLGRTHLPGVNVGQIMAEALVSDRATPLSIRPGDAFRLDGSRPVLSALHRLYRSADVPAHMRETYTRMEGAIRAVGTSPRGDEFDTVATMMGCGAVHHISLDGFDTHTTQRDRQARALQTLATGLARLLSRPGVAESTVIMVYSEFGRRVYENASGGTDHGAAGPVFLLGSHVRGGLHGEAPSLDSLDDGDLRHHVDFRSVYASVLDNWLGLDSGRILEGRFPRLSLFRQAG